MSIGRRSFLCLAAAFAAGATPARTVMGEGNDILLRDLYEKDLSFSELALRSEGQRIRVSGFMAPPLKAEARFFVLTKRPMAVCPFCDTEADWPLDILAIYTKRVVDVVPFNVAIVAEGVLELGSRRDEETGFLSRVRLADSTYART